MTIRSQEPHEVRGVEQSKALLRPVNAMKLRSRVACEVPSSAV